MAMDELPPTHREAIVLVGAAGLSYEEAAEIAGCALGTIKSRVNRARTRLAEILSVSSTAEFGPESRWATALSGLAASGDDRSS